jgi:hypothetical protein
MTNLATPPSMTVFSVLRLTVLWVLFLPNGAEPVNAKLTLGVVQQETTYHRMLKSSKKSKKSKSSNDKGGSKLTESIKSPSSESSKKSKKPKSSNGNKGESKLTKSTKSPSSASSMSPTRTPIETRYPSKTPSMGPSFTTETPTQLPTSTVFPTQLPTSTTVLPSQTPTITSAPSRDICTTIVCASISYNIEVDQDGPLFNQSQLLSGLELKILKLADELLQQTEDGRRLSEVEEKWKPVNITIAGASTRSVRISQFHNWTHTVLLLVFLADCVHEGSSDHCQKVIHELQLNNTKYAQVDWKEKIETAIKNGDIFCEPNDALWLRLLNDDGCSSEEDDDNTLAKVLGPVAAAVVLVSSMFAAAGTATAGATATSSAAACGEACWLSRALSTLWLKFGEICAAFFAFVYVFYCEISKGSVCHVVANKSQTVLDIVVKMGAFEDNDETEINMCPAIGNISLFEFKRVINRNVTETGEIVQVLSLPSAGKHRILGKKENCFYTVKSFTRNYDPEIYGGRKFGHRGQSGYIVHRQNRALVKKETFDERVLLEFVDFVPYVATPRPSNANEAPHDETLIGRNIAKESSEKFYTARQLEE